MMMMMMMMMVATTGQWLLYCVATDHGCHIYLTVVNVVCCVWSDREVNTLRAEMEQTKQFEKSAVYLSDFLS